MALSDLTEPAVRKAIEEFDRLGRQAFLKKMDLENREASISYLMGGRIDSKAIAGAAHGYLPGRSALTHADFSGGEATVQPALERLGFTVVNNTAEFPPFPGEVLTNEQIVRRFVVGNMGGMRRSTERNALVLISDPFKGLYQDRWEADVLHYTGMGPLGHQSLTYAQNQTLATSPSTGIPVHLLEALEPLKYTYAGEVELVGEPYQEEQLDKDGLARKVWMFPIRLRPGGAIPDLTESQARVIEDVHARLARKLPTDELRRRAKEAKRKPSTREAQTAVYIRDAAVAEYAKRMADGLCDLCEKPAPFHSKANTPYLECHHIIWLAQGGEDTIANTVALCPNCHRRMHVLNEKADRARLTKLALGRANG